MNASRRSFTFLFAFMLMFSYSVNGLAQQQKLALHSLFTDHAVLQQGQPVPVWGVAIPNTAVTVSFAGQTEEVTARDDGTWMVNLKALSANTSPAEMTVTNGSEVKTVSDLLVGEVWVCSGQSNMAWRLTQSTDFKTVMEEAKSGEAYKNIRLFKVPINGEDAPVSNVKATWTAADESTLPQFSATGFFFGRALARDLKVPIGLVQSANGGTNAYSWVNKETLESPAGNNTREFWDNVVKNEDKALERFEKAKVAWAEKVKAAREAGEKKPKGRAPRAPMSSKHVKRPTGHYNAMIAPLQPFAIRGAIWYQGEANSRPPFCHNYKGLMLGLVDCWRSDWAKASGTDKVDFPFYLVQLPNYARGHQQGWPIIREQMAQFGNDGINTGYVVTLDVGLPNDIHPPKKMPVGERLALLAQAKTYGKEIVFRGPKFSKVVEVDRAGAIGLKFETGSKLVSLDDQPLKFFQVAGEDKQFVDAVATISKNRKRLLVASDKVAKPLHVRYAWTNNPESPNFSDESGLPAAPFRTDDWEIEIEK